jgi:hypothetical protein
MRNLREVIRAAYPVRYLALCRLGHEGIHPTAGSYWIDTRMHTIGLLSSPLMVNGPWQLTSRSLRVS